MAGQGEPKSLSCGKGDGGGQSKGIGVVMLGSLEQYTHDLIFYASRNHLVDNSSHQGHSFCRRYTTVLSMVTAMCVVWRCCATDKQMPIYCHAYEGTYRNARRSVEATGYRFTK